MKNQRSIWATIIVVLISATIISGCSRWITSYETSGSKSTFLANKKIGVAMLSQDNNYVFFFIHTKTTSQLYKVNIDGSELILLCANLKRIYDPSFSPDRSKIIFCQTDETQGDLYAMDIDGTNRICLTSGSEHDFEPVFSPDGKKIYFLRARTFRNYSPVARPAWHDVDIYSINSEGTGLKQLTYESAYGMNNLSINPSGDTLMILGSGEYTNNAAQIWIVPLNDPTDKKSVQPNLEQYREPILFFGVWEIGSLAIDYRKLRNPRFSPDGKNIVFSWPHHNALYLMELQSGLTQQIWSWRSNEYQLSRLYPRFSQDGQQIIFSTEQSVDGPSSKLFGSHEPKIWIVNADGTELRQVDIK